MCGIRSSSARLKRHRRKSGSGCIVMPVFVFICISSNSFAKWFLRTNNDQTRIKGITPVPIAPFPFSHLMLRGNWPFMLGNHRWPVDFLPQRASNFESVSMKWCHPVLFATLQFISMQEDKMIELIFIWKWYAPLSVYICMHANTPLQWIHMNVFNETHLYFKRQTTRKLVSSKDT